MDPKKRQRSSVESKAKKKRKHEKNKDENNGFSFIPKGEKDDYIATPGSLTDGMFAMTAFCLAQRADNSEINTSDESEVIRITNTDKRPVYHLS